MSHHKIDLVIIASFRQSKNFNSFGLPIRWLEKILWHGSLWEDSHFQWHIRWIPFPTQQHQDHQREGPTSCLWGCKWGFQQRRIKDKTWEAKCSESRWHWSGFHQPCQTWSQTMRPRCRRDWKLLYFFQIWNFTYTVKAHCHRLSKLCWCILSLLGQLVWKGQRQYYLKQNGSSKVKQRAKTSLALLKMARMPRTWQVGWSDPVGPSGLQSKR